MGRKQTEETKAKIRKALTKPKLKKQCKYCGEEFEIGYSKRHQLFCSKSCSTKYIHIGSKRSKKTCQRISKGVLQNYKDGKQVYGGTTKWLDYMGIKVQGTYELRTCFILDKWKKEGEIKDWEYTNDKVNYIGKDGKEHTYLLDFKVFKNENSFYYIETKGFERPNDSIKWKAVGDAGYKLQVWFDKDIKEIEETWWL
jgi:hypothetical protein